MALLFLPFTVALAQSTPIIILKPANTQNEPTTITEGEQVKFSFHAYHPQGDAFSIDVQIDIEAPDGHVATDQRELSVSVSAQANQEITTPISFPTLNLTGAAGRANGQVTIRLRNSSEYSVEAASQWRERTFTVRPDETLAGPPADLEAESGIGTMTLNWSPPTSLGTGNGKTATVIRWEVRHGGRAEIADSPWTQWQGSTKNYGISGLKAHQLWSFQVRAVTAAGPGAIASTSARQLNSAPTVRLNPIAATIYSAKSRSLDAIGTDADTNDTLRYTWTTTPPNTGTFSNNRIANPTWTAPRVRVPTEVTLQVGVSDRSQQDSASHKITVHPALVELTPASQSISEGDAGTQRINLNLGYAGTGVSFPQTTTARVKVTAPQVELVNPPTSVTIPAGQSSTTFSVDYRGNVMDHPDRKVKVTLRPNDWYTPSPSKSTATITIEDDDALPPSAPSGLTASAGYRQVTLSWTAPTQTGLLNNATAPITGYEYRVAATTTALADATWVAIPDSAEATTHIVPRLALESDYAFDVRVRTAVGAGPASAAATATTRGLPKVSVTSATDSTTLTEGDTMEFNLNVTTGALDRNGPLRVYFQIVDPDGRLSNSTLPREVTIPGEMNNYSIRLATKTNDLVDGDSTINITVRTGAGYNVDTDAPSVQLTVEDDDDNPGAPTALSSEAGYRQVTLSWTPPDGHRAVERDGYRDHQLRIPGIEGRDQAGPGHLAVHCQQCQCHQPHDHRPRHESGLQLPVARQKLARHWCAQRGAQRNHPPPA